jgi:hypothetical protein
LECALLEEGYESLKQHGGCDCIAGTRIDSEQLTFIVVKVNEIETDAAVTCRCNLHLSTAMGQRFHSRLEHQSSDGVEHDFGTSTVCRIVNQAFERPIFQNKELIKGRCRRRIRPELLPIDSDNARSAPLANLAHRTANSPIGADD